MGWETALDVGLAGPLGLVILLVVVGVPACTLFGLAVILKEKLAGHR